MDILDPGFCAQYTSAPDVEERIARGASRFYRGYQGWQSQGRPPDPYDMVTHFGSESSDFTDAANALMDGDTSEGKQNGGVLGAGDCRLFQGYLGLGPQAESEYKSSIEQLLGSAGLTEAQVANFTNFEVSLRAMFSAQKLTPLQRATVNGTLIVKVDFDRLSHISSDVREQMLFVIPGRSVLESSIRRNLSDVFWKGVDTTTKEILDSIGVKLLNLDYAVQLRLGGEGDDSPMKPIDAGSGFIILGGV